MSVDYYTRLEQGRENHPSPSLLSALGRVLRLSPDEQLHLHRLAGVDPTGAAAPTSRTIPVALRRLLDQWPVNPAFIFNDVQDILAANALGVALHAGFEHTDNFARMVFLDRQGPRFFVEWEKVAAGTVATLRQTWGRPAARGRVQPVIDELRTHSDEFARLWSSHVVAGKSHETKSLDHPAVGSLELDYHAFEVAGVSGQYLLVCQAEAGSHAEQALRLLGSIAASSRQRPGQARGDLPGE
ncbi:hypothetical protein HNR02_000618 [Amycolatopsis endophytica]|uniref:MmyB-like transcription regulator ligand binding domain-containing protein n=1 Tax=Amycolatopsis endophytica TaxID=860233 RepID=A0A853AXE1_9PSEU|nr:hypothetical protein [Amycolatopsis endophytica]